MPEFTCVVCGKKGIDRTPKGDQKYCGKKCAKIARMPVQCLFNEGVFCSMKNCARCGWNPSVAKEREEKIRETICSTAG